MIMIGDIRHIQAPNKRDVSRAKASHISEEVRTHLPSAACVASSSRAGNGDLGQVQTSPRDRACISSDKTRGFTRVRVRRPRETVRRSYLKFRASPVSLSTRLRTFKVICGVEEQPVCRCLRCLQV